MITVIVAAYMIITTPFGPPVAITFDSIETCQKAQMEILIDMHKKLDIYRNCSVVCVEK